MRLLLLGEPEDNVVAGAVRIVVAEVVVERKRPDLTAGEQLDRRARGLHVYPAVWGGTILQIVVQPNF